MVAYLRIIWYWEECLEAKLEPDVKGRIIGVNMQMSKYCLLFGLKLCERILKITDNLSMALQTESLSAAEAQSIAADTISSYFERYEIS